MALPWKSLAVLFCAACREPVPAFTDDTVDRDGDGFAQFEDCDDTNADVHPNAVEITRDGIDNDCDFAVDCEDPDLIDRDWLGDLEPYEFAEFCPGFCARVVTGVITVHLAYTGMALEELACLTEVRGRLGIEVGPGLLGSVSGLNALARVGELSVHGNSSLTTLKGLENLESAGRVQVIRNEVLQTLWGLEGLVSITGDLEIDGHSVLTDVTALHGLVRVDGDVTITNNTVLTNKAAQDLVDAIDEIGGRVTVSGNDPRP